MKRQGDAINAILDEGKRRCRFEIVGASNWWEHVRAFLGDRRYWSRRADFDGVLTAGDGEGKIQITSPVEFRYVRPLLWRADIGL